MGSPLLAHILCVIGAHYWRITLRVLEAKWLGNHTAYPDTYMAEPSDCVSWVQHGELITMCRGNHMASLSKGMSWEPHG